MRMLQTRNVLEMCEGYISLSFPSNVLKFFLSLSVNVCIHGLETCLNFQLDKLLLFFLKLLIKLRAEFHPAIVFQTLFV